MTDIESLAERFEADRARLRAVAYRMLGSSEADDVVQEAWIRLSRTDSSRVTNLSGWLTTVVSRLCLDTLRSRRTRREESLDARRTDSAGGADPESGALLAESVGPALGIVLDTLPPAERLALVLHHMFGMPFDEVATVIGRSPAATRQLASRARRRVQEAELVTRPDLGVRRRVDAFLAASRTGDLATVLGLLS